jgi:hypothetical protein
MTCVKGSIDDLYFVKWIAPEVGDTEQIMRDVRALHRATGKQLHYVAIIGAELEPPSEEVRASMRKNIDELLRYCASVHLVIEGKGFRRAMARSIGTGIFLLSKNRGRTFAHDTVEHALAKIGMDAGAIGKTLERAKAMDLLNVAAA